jgi:hypothetical protein
MAERSACTVFYSVDVPDAVVLAVKEACEYSCSSVARAIHPFKKLTCLLAECIETKNNHQFVFLTMRSRLGYRDACAYASSRYRLPWTEGSRRRRAVAMKASLEEELPEKMRSIVNAFQMVPDPMARYKQLLYFAAKMEGLDQSQKIERNKVQACPFCHMRNCCASCTHCMAACSISSRSQR